MKSLAADVPHSPPIIIPYTNEEKCHFDTAVRYVRIHMYVRTNIDVKLLHDKGKLHKRFPTTNIC